MDGRHLACCLLQYLLMTEVAARSILHDVKSDSKKNLSFVLFFVFCFLFFAAGAEVGVVAARLITLLLRHGAGEGVRFVAGALPEGIRKPTCCVEVRCGGGCHWTVVLIEAGGRVVSKLLHC